MKLKGVHHLNIRCAVSDLPAIEKFYGEVMGLKKGDRPNFPNPGIWLWHDNHPSRARERAVRRRLSEGKAPRQR